ncbi:MarR family winged helix-turn-helix transcriptional regulator [Microbacterium album]|uniref:HTH marR-type domain-containing protein n=1 Tax=Microbacterium album TaxID=2053191 RepID=A0A917IIB2_9MICO|nr:MarR family transcriptional regulator [Microbacterium album]GGH47188.1 hypothetical protein GCM10010921_23750 [Microbacterium album]
MTVGPGPRRNQRQELPTELPYHVDALTAVSALVYIWTLPAFQHALGEQVEANPDVPVQLLVRHLEMFGPQSPTALARDLGMTRSNVSKIVGRAEARALLVRVVDHEDARSIQIRLVEAGRDLARRTLAIGDAMMRQLTKEWAAQELQAWTDLSHRLSREAARYAERIIGGH